jgi:hypothetical protein
MEGLAEGFESRSEHGGFGSHVLLALPSGRTLLRKGDGPFHGVC